jgi:hypothetical protein
LSGAEDIRLMRVVLPSPDPATSLAEAARQLGLPQPAFPATRGNSLEDLYQAEREFARWIRRHPAFSFAGGECGERTRARLGTGSPGRMERGRASLADVWLADAAAV